MKRRNLILMAMALTGAAALGTTAGAEGVEDWPVVTTAVVPTQPVTDEEMVETALNEYLVSIDAGIQMDIIPIEFGNLSTTMTLMLTSPEDPIDVFSYNFFSKLTSVVANEQVVPLDEFLEEYPDIVDVVGEEYLPLGQINGTQYALPNIGAYGQIFCYALRSDIAEAIGYADKEGQLMTLQEITEMLLKAKEAFPELAFITNEEFGIMNIDRLGDSNCTGVLMNNGIDNTEVVNLYATDTFKEFLDCAVQWKEAGLFLDDPLNQPLDKSYMKTGVSGGSFHNGFSVEDARQGANVYGYDWKIYPITEPVATAQSASGSGYCISSVTRDEEASKKALYLMYTDENVMRFLAQGVEGAHYVVDENGCSWYPEGESMTSLGWGTGAQWYFPNQTLCIPFETDNPHYYEEMLASNDNCQKSKAIGFAFDSEPVYDEYAAVTAVIEEYRDALVFAQVDVDSYLEEFLGELEAAGIDDVIAEKQSQLDAFLAAEE